MMSGLSVVPTDMSFAYPVCAIIRTSVMRTGILFASDFPFAIAVFVLEGSCLGVCWFGIWVWWCQSC
jgi:hypothetical protein